MPICRHVHTQRHAHTVIYTDTPTGIHTELHLEKYIQGHTYRVKHTTGTHNGHIHTHAHKAEKGDYSVFPKVIIILPKVFFLFLQHAVALISSDGDAHGPI